MEVFALLACTCSEVTGASEAKQHERGWARIENRERRGEGYIYSQPHNLQNFSGEAHERLLSTYPVISRHSALCLGITVSPGPGKEGLQQFLL